MDRPFNEPYKICLRIHNAIIYSWQHNHFFCLICPRRNVFNWYWVIVFTSQNANTKNQLSATRDQFDYHLRDNSTVISENSSENAKLTYFSVFQGLTTAILSARTCKHLQIEPVSHSVCQNVLTYENSLKFQGVKSLMCFKQGIVIANKTVLAWYKCKAVTRR